MLVYAFLYAIHAIYGIFKIRSVIFLLTFGSIFVQNFNSFPFFVPEKKAFEVSETKISFRNIYIVD